MSLFNKTTYLLMPMVYYNEVINGIDILTTKAPKFIKAYIADVNRPEYDDKLILVYSDKEEVFDVPAKYLSTYWYIITSQYHLVSDDYWEYLVKFWGAFKPPKSEDEFEIFDEVYNMGVS